MALQIAFLSERYDVANLTLGRHLAKRFLVHAQKFGDVFRGGELASLKQSLNTNVHCGSEVDCHSLASSHFAPLRMLSIAHSG